MQENKSAKDPNSVEDLYQEEKEAFRDAISTVDEDGKRIWVYPKKPHGRYTRWRNIVSTVLLVILFSGPLIKISGEPLLLLNVFNRKFVIFGQVFWPQDFHLFALSLITLVVFIILFTAAYGRIFCGWICPQTIFMENVFRKVEYWIEGDYMAQKKLNKMPWNRDKILKKGTKHFIFLIISFVIMHTFISYLIGFENMVEIVQSPPSENLSGFMVMIGFTAAFYGVFSQFREQVCTTVCPYGRLQGVLMDRNSLVVAYDHVRGEQRQKLRKAEDRDAADLGDCIDCKQCVVVCPTGIDIRNGTQLECVNCTACIDACDNIMDRVGFKRGLIRYASESNISDHQPFRFTPRLKAYSAAMVLLIGVMISLLILRTDIETTVLRTPGLLYQEKSESSISNLYNYKVINKTNRELPLELRLENNPGKIELVGELSTVASQGVTEGAFFIILKRNALKKMSTKLKVGIYSDGKKLETVKTTFLGPSI
ncbi:MAG: cytochrome c oxidase accessory protein CcoG [Cyclobacteriaceae bacterium]|nr:cytochrome c oxidase accessory protein CcoG [Cyclobacteriaceae bacterium HetDA_MAG_MS6]